MRQDALADAGRAGAPPGQPADLVPRQHPAGPSLSSESSAPAAPASEPPEGDSEAVAVRASSPAAAGSCPLQPGPGPVLLQSSHEPGSEEGTPALARPMPLYPGQARHGLHGNPVAMARLLTRSCQAQGRSGGTMIYLV